VAQSLFDTGPEDQPPLAARLAPALHAWADRGVFFGTSSWKYPGWVGSVYSRDRYLTRGKFSTAKFDRECLAEYATTFPTVGGDFSFYQFPAPRTWEGIFAGLPAGFTIGLKVPEAVTVSRWPGHARYGAKAGHANDFFLDAGLFEAEFTRALEPYRDHVGVMIFEFGTFAKKDFDTPGEFLERLGEFLGRLPPGWRYAVELRNPEYLGPNYFSCLSRHNVAHVFNAWTRMPTIAEQITLPGAFTADFCVVRALLRHGRTYEKAVSLFEPYERVQEPDLSTREAIRRIAEQCVREKRRAYAFVNNRLEGNAPGTIEAVVTEDGA
jgi:uncharacterized protein YecE (DUF72 family)